MLLERTRQVQGRLLIPVGPLAQVWRSGARQARLAKLLDTPGVQAVGLSLAGAKAAGELCGRRGTSDVIDASVIVLARQTKGLVLTSDPDDLRHLDPGIAVTRV